jgi:hypothetical protein
MGSAWYPRPQVLALREALAAPPSQSPSLARADQGRPPATATWSDAQLIGHLRGRARAADGCSAPHPRTAVDLVADTGISIARAERVYRFWLAHDAHPVAEEARALAGKGRTPPPERRSESRVQRDALIHQLRDADPAVRSAAFQKLKALR